MVHFGAKENKKAYFRPQFLTHKIVRQPVVELSTNRK